MKYLSGYKYMLAEDVHMNIKVHPDKDIKTPFICLTKGGILTIKKNYCWDGASGPTKDTKTNMTPALMHDACYQLMRMDKLSQKWRKTVDQEFRRMCLQRGMWRVRAWYFYRAVRKFGLSSASAESRRQVIEVP